jgi:hypothetical protein
VTTTRVRKKQRRRERRKKIVYLRQRIADTHDESRRQRLIAKLHRVSRDAPVETG